jgi:hypothetical protein
MITFDKEAKIKRKDDYKIDINLRAEWMLEEKIYKKIKLKKGQKKQIQVHASQATKFVTWSWDLDIPIKNKLNKIMKLNSQTIQCWMAKLK